MFRPELFEQLHLEARPIGWAVAFEMGIKAQLAGLKLGEVPIVSIDRLYGGKSTFVARDRGPPNTCDGSCGDCGSRFARGVPRSRA